MSRFYIPVELLDSGMKLADIAPVSGVALLEETEREARALFQQAVESIKVIRRKYITSISCSFGILLF